MQIGLRQVSHTKTLIKNFVYFGILTNFIHSIIICGMQRTGYFIICFPCLTEKTNMQGIKLVYQEELTHAIYQTLKSLINNLKIS